MHTVRGSYIVAGTPGTCSFVDRFLRLFLFLRLPIRSPLCVDRLLLLPLLLLLLQMILPLGALFPDLPLLGHDLAAQACLGAVERRRPVVHVGAHPRLVLLVYQRGLVACVVSPLALGADVLPWHDSDLALAALVFAARRAAPL